MASVDQTVESTGKSSRISRSIARIVSIAEIVCANSYLEVGVAGGKTFHGVNIPRKVAVDPKFRFDIAPHARDGVEFYSMPSDEFFIGHSYGRKFDVIFLDGLHTFQQTLRDFCNSVACAHDRTVWLVDDVLPIDVYSAWPNQHEAVEFRRREGGKGPAWQGDVFKVLFAIHDFFPLFSFVTLRTRKAQAIVWKSPRTNFSPIFNSMEAIERLSYFDLLKHEKTLNMQSERDAFDLLAASLKVN